MPVEWAEQLERERDEAREALKHISEYGTDEITAAVELRQKLATALVERDEAMEELHDIRLNLGEDADGYTLLHAVCVIQNKMADALQDADLRTLDFERMKQERDIAEDERIDMAKQLESEKECHARCQNERDKALTSQEFVIAQHKVITELMLERDKARAALMRIEDLFLDGTDIYADRENMGLIARAALEETK